MDVIRCENCKAKADKAVVYYTGRRIPLCENCSNAFRMGQGSDEAVLVYIERVNLVRLEDGTYEETCRRCGHVQTYDVANCPQCDHLLSREVDYDQAMVPVSN